MKPKPLSKAEMKRQKELEAIEKERENQAIQHLLRYAKEHEPFNFFEYHVNCIANGIQHISPFSVDKLIDNKVKIFPQNYSHVLRKSK